MDITLEECSRTLGVPMNELAEKMRACQKIPVKIFDMGELPDLKSTDN